MHRLESFRDLYDQNHTLGLYCMRCNRWGSADLLRLIRDGLGDRAVTKARFRCKDCGSVVDKQVRPPVPEIGGAVAWVQMAG